MTEKRADYRTAAPRVFEAMLALEMAARAGGIESSLVELVKLRASQINGCAYCIDMHTKDARAAGETEQRLYLLSAWREAPVYTHRERAALAWTETLTLVADGGVSDSDYKSAREIFSERELTELSLVIIAINGWNRLAIGFHAEVGGYQPTSSQ